MVFKILGKIFGAIGIVLLLITLLFTGSIYLFISQAQVAEGTVINAAPRNTSTKSVAQIRFSDANGQIIQFTTSVKASPPEFELGQKVKVYYNLANPQPSARPDSFLSLWFFPALSGLFAVAFGGIGIGFLVARF